MNLLDRYTNTLSFRDYDDFYRHFRLHVPKNFNFAYNIVDEYARLDPQKRAMVWCDDLGGEEFFTCSAHIKRISDKRQITSFPSASEKATGCSSSCSAAMNTGRR